MTDELEATKIFALRNVAIEAARAYLHTSTGFRAPEAWRVRAAENLRVALAEYDAAMKREQEIDAAEPEPQSIMGGAA